MTMRSKSPRSPLCRRRLEVGLTLDQMAKRLRVPKTSLHAWETGKRRPWPRTIPKLALALRWTASELIDAVDQAAVRNRE